MDGTHGHEARLDSSIALPPANGRPNAAERERAAIRLIETHEADVRRTVRRYSICQDDADDAYQRALEILLTKAPTVDEDQLIRWTQTVAKHEAMAVRRRRERALGGPLRHDPAPDAPDPIERLPDDGADPAELAARRERVARSSEALSRLKPHEVRALMLKATGYSYAEIGEITGWTRTKINRCMAEGRKRFLELYRGIEEGERCEELASALSAFGDGELDREGSEQVRLHLRGCRRCRTKLSQFRGLPAKVLELLPPAVPASQRWWARAHELVVGGLGDRVAGAGTKLHQALDLAAGQKVAVAVAVTTAAAGGTTVIAQENGGPADRPSRTTTSPHPEAEVEEGMDRTPPILHDPAPAPSRADRRNEPGSRPRRLDRARPQPPSEEAAVEAVGSPESSAPDGAGGEPDSAPQPRRPPVSSVPEGGAEEFGPG